MIIDYYNNYINHCKDIENKICDFPNLDAIDPPEPLVERINNLTESKDSSLDELYNLAKHIIEWDIERRRRLKENERRLKAEAMENERRLKAEVEENERRLKAEAEENERVAQEQYAKEQFEKYRGHVKPILALATYSAIIAPIINLQFFLLADIFSGLIWLIFYIFCILNLFGFPIFFAIFLHSFALADDDFKLHARIPNFLINIPVFKNIFESLAADSVLWVYNNDHVHNFICYISGIYFAFLILYKFIF
jgi:hypothetical protein